MKGELLIFKASRRIGGICEPSKALNIRLDDLNISASVVEIMIDQRTKHVEYEEQQGEGISARLVVGGTRTMYKQV